MVIVLKQIDINLKSNSSQREYIMWKSTDIFFDSSETKTLKLYI